MRPLRGEFGTALSAVYSVTIGSGTENHCLIAELHTSLRDGHWHKLRGPDGAGGIKVAQRKSQGDRMFGPFGQRLALRCWLCDPEDGLRPVAGTIEDVVLHMGVQYA
jgi:hypothetical protein